MVTDGSESSDSSGYSGVTPRRLPGLLVDGVAPLEPAVLAHLDPLTIIVLVLDRDVVAPLALGALEGDLHPLVTRHAYGSTRCAPASAGARFALTSPSVAIYLVILVTRPAPTVRPPSRIANRRPSSIAMGAWSSTLISVLSCLLYTSPSP